jgi:hypothetical protein
LRDSVGSVVGNPVIGRQLVQDLIGLEASQRRNEISVGEFIDAVERWLLSRPDWSAEERVAWNTARADLAKLLTTKSIVFASKAVDLSYDFDAIYQGDRIVTDIRPIFDEDRTEIIGATLTQTLRLQVYANFQYQEHSCVISAEDIAHLRDQCDRALKKAESARKLIEDKCRLDVVIGQEYGNVAD